MAIGISERGVYAECECGRLFLQRNYEKRCWICQIEEELRSSSK